WFATAPRSPTTRSPRHARFMKSKYKTSAADLPCETCSTSTSTRRKSGNREEILMRTRWTGCGTALVTPFTASNALNEAGMRRLARRQVDAGIHFLVPYGTTGETPTLSAAERRRVVELVVEEAGDKVPILAGAGGYNTHEVIEAVAAMTRAGA